MCVQVFVHKYIDMCTWINFFKTSQFLFVLLEGRLQGAKLIAEKIVFPSLVALCMKKK